MTRRYDTPDWQCAFRDVNVQYGGLWIRDYGDYAETLEVIDLDSATGATGRYLVETGSVGLYESTTSGNIQRVRNAMQCSGIDHVELRAMSRDVRRARIWEAMKAYGYGDTESTCVLADSDAPEVTDWDRDDMVTVDGADGIWEYLERVHGVEKDS